MAEKNNAILDSICGRQKNNDCPTNLLERQFLIRTSPEKYWITVQLYELSSPKVVYDTVVKSKFSAAFLNPALFTGSFLDLSIAAAKALSRFVGSCMITKSLPMEVLYSLSPRTGISDSLRAFGFKPTDTNVLVVWIHGSFGPPVKELELFRKVALENGRQLSLEAQKNLTDFSAISDIYDFPREIPRCSLSDKEHNDLLLSYVTSKIAVKE